MVGGGFFQAVFVRSAGWGKCDTGWDTHWYAERDTAFLAGPFDHAVAQLILDHKNGELDDTAIVIDTEFGRTPEIESAYRDSPGRDHHEWHTSTLVSSNVEGGAVIGKTDKDGVGIGSEADGVLLDDRWHTVIDRALRMKPERNATPIEGVPIF